MAHFKRKSGIAGKHTTVIDAAEPVVLALRSLQDTRITLGYITKLGGRGKRSIKYTDTLSGFRMKVIGNIYAQEFFVITKQAQKAKVVATRAFES